MEPPALAGRLCRPARSVLHENRLNVSQSLAKSPLMLPLARSDCCCDAGRPKLDTSHTRCLSHRSTPRLPT
eukprot:366406-Chlamydomonas_euryale.AAC.21